MATKVKSTAVEFSGGVYAAACLRTGRLAGYLVADSKNVRRPVAFIGLDAAGFDFPFPEPDALALARAIAGTPSLAMAMCHHELPGFVQLDSLNDFCWLRGLEFDRIDGPHKQTIELDAA